MDAQKATRSDLLRVQQKVRTLLCTLEPNTEVEQRSISGLSIELKEAYRSLSGNVILLVSFFTFVYKWEEVVLLASFRPFELVEQAYNIMKDKDVTVEKVLKFQEKALRPTADRLQEAMGLLKKREALTSYASNPQAVAKCALLKQMFEGVTKDPLPSCEAKDRLEVLQKEVDELMSVQRTVDRILGSLDKWPFTLV